MPAKLAVLVCLVVLTVGLDANRMKATAYPQCAIPKESNKAVEVKEGTSAGSCLVLNHGNEGALVRVMCGGADPNKDAKTDASKRDHDIATYAYVPAQRQMLLLEGQCRKGHRCRLCGVTKATPATGQDTSNKDFLQHQNYECQRRCRVVLYKHEDFNGELQTFSHNAPVLFGSNLKDKISAVKIIGARCDVTLYGDEYYQNELCKFSTGDFQEKTIDYWTLKSAKPKGCGCNDCITSMAVRESDVCGPGPCCPPEGQDCKPCKDGEQSISCCVKPKHRHGQVTQREEALKRLFAAMAAVLEE